MGAWVLTHPCTSLEGYRVRRHPVTRCVVAYWVLTHPKKRCTLKRIIKKATELKSRVGLGYAMKCTGLRIHTTCLLILHFT